ncbi:Zinc finger C2H2 [Penicillium argentinense]|uniref:Zinc finger C2H2 n=1 Tax=Penicillium argentinense TaxID=1131581 RepID=A0A9W9G561_9EURO|nr:Zinc finger C2H2 [Penicillium argentinense]KAJ5111487.1 Zinc finger C2H2 [Penicillium argentinense]
MQISSQPMMTVAQVDAGRTHPRRRSNLNSALPSLQTEPPSGTSKMPLRKGETFNTPTSPPSGDRDPVLSIRSLPRRAPTSLEAITSSEERMASILNRLTLDDSPKEKSSAPAKDDQPSSRAASKSGGKDSDSRDDHNSPHNKTTSSEEGHDSDSGLGSSVSSVESMSPLSKAMKEDIHSHDKTAITTSETFESGSTPKRQLGLAACKQIEKFVLVPILKEPKLKPFHALTRSVPSRIVNKQIVCLRDLEKTLLWLAPKSTSSRHAYLNFAEFTIQCLHTSASHLNDRDQRLPTDRPYTNGYFVDLVSQVRRYAAMIRASQERVQAAQSEKKSPYVQLRPLFNKSARWPARDKSNRLPSVAEAVLEGGLSINGKPAEIIVTQDGKPISMRTGEVYKADSPFVFKRTISFDQSTDEGVQRSMARRKKNAPPMDINQKCSHCDKVFKRPCDLTKHEKTHSRPWKCTMPGCKYNTIGWPTEKERDRHMNDKHSDNPALYKCSFKPCTYASKRESNCKQHMEKAHGWIYNRSKNNARGGSKRGSSLQATPRTPSVSTPASRSAADFPTPVSGPSPSPYDPPMFSDQVPFNFNDPPAAARSEDYGPLFETSPFSDSNMSGGMGGQDFSLFTSANLDAMENQFGAGDPNGLISSLSMHRQSMNSMSVPSAGSVPDLMAPSMSFDGSPLASSADPNLSFEYEWSRLEASSTMPEDYSTSNMQLPTPAYSDHSGLKQSTSGAMGMPHNYSYNTHGNVSGLSPNAQGNLMLYSPDSNGADGHHTHLYKSAGQPGNPDFPLYDNSLMAMNGQMVNPYAPRQQQPLRLPQQQSHQPQVSAQQMGGMYVASSEAMFPPLPSLKCSVAFRAGTRRT